MDELKYPFDSQFLLKKQKRIKRELCQNGKSNIKVKIAILSGATIGETQNILELFLLNYGIEPSFWQGDYNRYYEDAVFKNQSLVEFAPDLIYIHVTNKNVIEIIDYKIKQENYILPDAQSVFMHFKKLLDALHNNYCCPIIINNFEQLPYRVMGNADVWHPLGEMNLINEVNHQLYEYVRNTDGIYINDLNYEAAYYGLERWFDNSLWYMYKYPYSIDAIPMVCFNIANIIKAIFGKNKKVIVTDLDNTLWGGVIGDDGKDNIEIGLQTPKGMAYQDFQKYLKKLSKRGITLTISSKNDENIAKSGLLHTSGILTADDFISIKANWDPKSENIKKIISELNVMPDSVVFLDDNPVERDQVKSNLQSVSIPYLNKVEEYRKVLDQSGFFEIISITEDDLHRNEYYKQNTIRIHEEQNFNDYGEYLDSLEMTAVFDNINSDNIARVAQLLNKTNQFNLTTKRYTEEELQLFLEKPEHLGVCAKLIDKFGDNGIVTVLLGKKENKNLYISNWLMSCRVFKRDLEYALFDIIVEYCINNEIKTIIGEYIPSEKNKIVSEFYGSIGFSKLEKRDDVEIWRYKIPYSYIKLNNHIKNDERGNFK